MLKVDKKRMWRNRTADLCAQSIVSSTKMILGSFVGSLVHHLQKRIAILPFIKFIIVVIILDGARQSVHQICVICDL